MKTPALSKLLTTIFLRELENKLNQPATPAKATTTKRPVGRPRKKERK
jgi:hypothetical protein